jgi:hypothetical protein
MTGYDNSVNMLPRKLAFFFHHSQFKKVRIFFAIHYDTSGSRDAT